MDVLSAIRERTSYRGTYKDVSVPKEDVRKIMEAGLAAPSGCNKQTTSIIAVDDPALLSKLRACTSRPFAQTAPVFICVLTREIIAYKNTCFNVQDYSACIENMLLAAVALGYQSCWYEGYMTDEDQTGKKFAAVLGIPPDYSLVCVLPIGVADEPIKPPRKKPFEERAWFNGFMTGAEA